MSGLVTARRDVVEGKQVTVVETQPPLPPRLDQLLAAMYAITVCEDIRPAGAAAQCERDRTHRFGVLRAGRHLGLDRELRDLRIDMCRDCGATCVRDVTFDRIAGLPVGRRGPLRRDHILGWYSGARRNGRTFL